MTTTFMKRDMRSPRFTGETLATRIQRDGTPLVREPRSPFDVLVSVSFNGLSDVAATEGAHDFSPTCPRGSLSRAQASSRARRMRAASEAKDLSCGSFGGVMFPSKTTGRYI
jgi:hypothetical protein